MIRTTDLIFSPFFVGSNGTSSAVLEVNSMMASNASPLPFMSSYELIIIAKILSMSFRLAIALASLGFLDCSETNSPILRMNSFECAVF